MSLLRKVLLGQPRSGHATKTSLERDLLRQEAKIGGRLFGIVKPRHRRDFFCLDETTWIWYEQWVDGKGKQQAITTRYSIEGGRLIKHQSNANPVVVAGQELVNFGAAVREYYYQVAEGVYGRPVRPS